MYKMGNEEHFKELVNKLIDADSKYDNELNIFVNYSNFPHQECA